ncbi:ABC transporter substrate-binding protein [Novosphingobium sp. KCTC 2891]|uniref:ABC transporter substrate-binding protein n=1 Tax=Novosphingobium sp. KCTC 2891 TaxID=2989730 RepID=UPI00222348F3|nr:ABC transporter substrate-binding protein [Novosphingobium sp. KCTC 2891]MCW1383549.1 ABC transporter substrate-binding protein [Novosphingobium sp. KCTC 2891]
MVVSRLVSDRRSFLAGTIASLGILPGLAACAGGKTNGVVLGDQVHLLQAKLEAAGALEGAGYPISWGNFPGAAPLLEALNAGAVDTAPAGDLPVVLAAAAGCRLKIAAVTRSAPESMAIIVPGGSPIRTVADLAGKSVIVSSARGSISHYLLLEALREAGVPASAVKIGFMLPNDAASAFASGQIEAWAIFGIYQAKAEAAGARILRDGRGIGPGYTLIAVSEAALSDPKKKATIADVLARAQRANAWCRAHPEPYAQIYARQTGVDISLARKMVAREQPALTAPDDAFANDLQRAADRFLDYGVLPRRVKVFDLLAPDLVKG